MTDAQRSAILELNSKGLSDIQISRSLNLWATSVKRFLRASSLTSHRTLQVKVQASDYPRIVKLYAEGRSIIEIASQWGVCFDVMRKHLLKAGVSLRRPVKRSVDHFRNDIIEQCVALYAERKGKVRIAKQLGVAESVVSRILRNAGVHSETMARGDRHGMWKGGTHVNNQGYIFVRAPMDFPYVEMVMANGYVAEHRKNLALKLGRSLKSKEQVHHIDGNRMNNDPDNLELRHGAHGTGICMKCADCGSLNIIAEELKK